MFGQVSCVSTSVSPEIELVQRNSSTSRVDILVTDVNGNPIDASALTLTITDLNDVVLYADDFFTPPTPPGVTRIVKPASTTGQYYFVPGDQTIIANTETANIGDLIFNWQVTTPGAEPVSVIQIVKIVSGRTLRLLAYFRDVIDKARKNIDTNPLNPMHVGYTDEALMKCLEHGLGYINSYQPSIGWANMDDFPDSHRWLLMEAALYAGVVGQTIFAADTDIETFSDLGGSWTVSHHPKYAAMLQYLASRLDIMVPAMKKQFYDVGVVSVETGTNFRIATLLSSGPSGAIFRNLFFAGPL